jgi:hypothetical protein
MGLTLMKAKTYSLIEKCVEEGIRHGFSKAHKHDMNPSQSVIEMSIHDAVMLEISEWFTFDELE